jgi:hypothetical protein
MIDRAVVNAGPLVALSLLGQLELLPALFSEVWVPQSVIKNPAASYGVSDTDIPAVIESESAIEAGQFGA